jgi:hypothetical protein
MNMPTPDTLPLPAADCPAGSLDLQLQATLELQRQIRARLVEEDLDALEDLISQHGSRLSSIAELLLEAPAELQRQPDLLREIQSGLTALEAVVASRLKVMGTELRKCGELRAALHGYVQGSATEGSLRRVSLSG